MAYVKQNWETGELITSQKLNHMEDGIENAGGGALVINRIDDEDNSQFVLDKTFEEIEDALMAGTPCIIVDDTYDTKYYTMVTSAVADPDINQFSVLDGTEGRMSYLTHTENGYPSYYYGD